MQSEVNLKFVGYYIERFTQCRWKERCLHITRIVPRFYFIYSQRYGIVLQFFKYYSVGKKILFLENSSLKGTVDTGEVLPITVYNRRRHFSDFWYPQFLIEYVQEENIAHTSKK